MALATILALTFGRFATDLSRWIVCALSVDVCSDAAKRDAAMLAAMVSTFVAVYGAAIAGLRGKRPPVEAKLLVVGALVGAFFAVLKAAEGDGGYPVLKDVAGPLVVYALALVVFIAASASSPDVGPSAHRPLSILRRTATVFFAAAIIGSTLQYAGQIALTETNSSRSVREMVIAPLVSVLGGAMIGSMMLESRPFRRRDARLAFWLTVSTIVMLVWFLTIYLPKHTGTAGWMTESPLPIWRVGLAYVGLPMVTVMLMAAFALVGGPEGYKRWIVAALVVSTLVAGWFGTELATARASNLTDGQQHLLTAIHATTPFLALLSLLIALSLDSLLSRYAHGQQRP